MAKREMEEIKEEWRQHLAKEKRRQKAEEMGRKRVEVEEVEESSDEGDDDQEEDEKEEEEEERWKDDEEEEIKKEWEKRRELAETTSEKEAEEKTAKPEKKEAAPPVATPAAGRKMLIEEVTEGEEDVVVEGNKKIVEIDFEEEDEKEEEEEDDDDESGAGDAEKEAEEEEKQECEEMRRLNTSLSRLEVETDLAKRSFQILDGLDVDDDDDDDDGEEGGLEEISLVQKEETKEQASPGRKQKTAWIEEITILEEGQRPSSLTPPPSPSPRPAPPPPPPRQTQLTSNYEFVQRYNALKRGDVAGFRRLLADVAPAQIPKFVSNKLDGPMLQLFVDAVADLVVGDHEGLPETGTGDLDDAFQILNHLHRVERFSIVFMFAGEAERTKLTKTFGAMKRMRCQDNAFSDHDVTALTGKYGLKM